MIFRSAPLSVLGFGVEGNPARFYWTAMRYSACSTVVIGSALTFLVVYRLLPRLTGGTIAKHLAQDSARGSDARLVVG
jgi:hypothetical protein